MSESDINNLAQGHSRQDTAHHVWFSDKDGSLSAIVCEIPSREDLTAEDYDALWFSSEDFLRLKCDARSLSLESERTGFSKHLDDTFNEKNKENQTKINKWVSDGPQRRGLERLANAEHGNIRQQEQFTAIMDVLRAQDDMIIARREIDRDELRKISTKATRLARHFARMIAKADADAADVELPITSYRESKPLPEKGHNKKEHTRDNRKSDHQQHEHHHRHKSKHHNDAKDPKDKEETKINRAGVFRQAYKETKQIYKDTKAGIIARIPRIA